jgi:hypothetical protein
MCIRKPETTLDVLKVILSRMYIRNNQILICKNKLIPIRVPQVQLRSLYPLGKNTLLITKAVQKCTHEINIIVKPYAIFARRLLIE